PPSPTLFPYTNALPIFVAHRAVVRDVRVRHEQVIAADERHALVVGRAAVHGAAFAKHIAVADRKEGRLTLVFLVLWRIADRCELEEAVVGADGGRPVDHHMRSDHRTRADAHPGTYDAERPDADVGRELGLGRDDRARIDHLEASGASIISACATSCSPTEAAVE